MLSQSITHQKLIHIDYDAALVYKPEPEVPTLKEAMVQVFDELAEMSPEELAEEIKNTPPGGMGAAITYALDPDWCEEPIPEESAVEEEWVDPAPEEMFVKEPVVEEAIEEEVVVDSANNQEEGSWVERVSGPDEIFENDEELKKKRINWIERSAGQQIKRTLD